MKTLFAVAVILVLVMPVYGQVDKFDYTLSAGACFPDSLEVFNYCWKTGIEFSFSVYYQTWEYIFLGVSVDYYFFGLNKSKWDDFHIGKETYDYGNRKVFTFMPSVIFKVPGKINITPYFEAGGGLFVFIKDPVTDFSHKLVLLKNSMRGSPGINFGGGIEIDTGRQFRIILDMDYTTGFTPGNSLSFLSISIGLRF